MKVNGQMPVCPAVLISRRDAGVPVQSKSAQPNVPRARIQKPVGQRVSRAMPGRIQVSGRQRVRRVPRARIQMVPGRHRVRCANPGSIKIKRSKFHVMLCHLAIMPQGVPKVGTLMVSVSVKIAGAVRGLVYVQMQVQQSVFIAAVDKSLAVLRLTS